MKPFSLLIKPVSADCNLRCEYCFYLDRAELYPDSKTHFMDDRVLERLISSYMLTAQPRHQFGWQGGEPALLGTEFFARAVRLQEKHGARGASIANGIQTNATLIDNSMAELFAKHNFLAGVSIDGPAELHDRFRKSADGMPTHSRVLQGIGALNSSSVEFNALTLVNSANVKRGGEIYRYLRGLGIRYHQYIPCVEFRENGSPLPYSIKGGEWGKFLCEIFDEWMGSDTRTVSVRLFDSLLNLMVLGKRTICTMEDDCRNYFLVEHNGDVYPCDFFVEKNWMLGNIMRDSWEQLQSSAKYARFGMQKSRINKQCRRCDFLRYCMGDCLKHRFAKDRDPETLSWLCSGWKKFFSHALPGLDKIARTLSKSLQNPGRNSPCPCGSGKKYKYCHMGRVEEPPFQKKY